MKRIFPMYSRNRGIAIQPVLAEIFRNILDFQKTEGRRIDLHLPNELSLGLGH
jgi:hypothetical protein